MGQRLSDNAGRSGWRGGKMNFAITKANLPEDGGRLKALMDIIVPEEVPFGAEVWEHQDVECYWVFVEDQQVGMIVFQKNAGVGAKYEQLVLPHVPEQLYLLFGGLLKEWRFRGIGSLAFHWLTTKAKRMDDIERIVSNIRVSNEASEELHRRQEFQKGIVIEGYYQNPEEATQVMVLELSRV